MAETKLGPKPRGASKAAGSNQFRPGSREAAALAKDQILWALENGMTVRDACQYAGRSEDAWKRYKDHDFEFREKAEAILERRKSKNKLGENAVPDFPEFCEKYLGMRLFLHQLQWYDILEGREPRDLHPSQTFIQGAPSNIVINTPPNHAKSTTITVAYSVWRILRDPNVKILLVSKRQGFAANFLYAIKSILTSARYRPLQTRWAPAEGFEKASAEWSATQIRLVDDETDFEKDPTVQVLGIGGQIYGSRADLIIVDDAVVLENVAQWESQLRWIRQEVDSRLYSESSKLLVVGTRVAPVDLYSALLDPNNYDGEDSPWTYLSQPAVLEQSDDPDKAVTLWPRSNQRPREYEGEPDEDGLFPKWDYAALMKKRRSVDARTWSLVYQQEQVSETTVFAEDAVRGCVDRMRNPGPLIPGLSGHPARPIGTHVIAGLDPAAVGHTAAVALALERDTGTRWVLDVHNEARMTPDAMRALIYDWTERLGVQEWRIEQNAFQAFLVQDREVNQWLASRGVLLTGHLTGRNKTDPQLGVASMAGLFKGYLEGWNKIRLPNLSSNGVKALVEQLVTWFPETKAKTDTVMALWFADLRARELVADQQGANFINSRWLSKRQLDQRQVIDVFAQKAGVA